VIHFEQDIAVSSSTNSTYLTRKTVTTEDIVPHIVCNGITTSFVNVGGFEEFLFGDKPLVKSINAYTCLSDRAPKPLIGLSGDCDLHPLAK